MFTSLQDPRHHRTWVSASTFLYAHVLGAEIFFINSEIMSTRCHAALLRTSAV